VTRILRLARQTDFVTAAVFESLFDRHLGAAFEVRRASPDDWCTAILGPLHTLPDLADAATRFATATSDIDFICPGYEAIPLAPLLVALRDRARSSARLLFIAHAAGAYAMEWALIWPFLVPGDVIVAPSKSAARAIHALCPAVTPYVRVISHPMEPLNVPHGRTTGPARIVTLSRIQPEKLIHRQIEAMALLAERRAASSMPVMDIAGVLDSTYARTLAAKIQRLGLTRHVRLVGAVRGDAHKAEFLADARVLVNLSVTVEESFPKAPVEALGAGIPVLATAWDGLYETVGPGGALVPLSVDDTPEGRADAPAWRVAEALERLIADPLPPDLCRAHASRFAPEVGVPLYRAALAESLDARVAPVAWPEPPAMDESAAPPCGLLSAANPLPQLGWDVFFAWYVESCAAIRAGWVDAAPASEPAGFQVRALVQSAVHAALVRLFAGPPVALPEAPTPVPCGSAGVVTGTLGEQLAAAAAAPGHLGGRVASFRAALASGWDTQAALPVVDRLSWDGLDPVSVATLRAMVAERNGDCERAFLLCAASLVRWPPGEWEAGRLRQLARLARRLGQPARALPWLAAWLERFPDGAESAAVWLDRALGAAAAGEAHVVETDDALARSRELLVDTPVVTKAARTIAAQRVARAFA
jgi:glycosyltransferase involved in cell wall biosynthesis